MSRRASRLTAIHALLLIALVEVVINRIAVPMLRESRSDEAWYSAMFQVGLFAFYFANTLAVLVVIARCVSAFRGRRDARNLAAHVALGLAALIAAVPLIVSVPGWMNLALEIWFGVAVIAVLATAFGRRRDLGAQVGVAIVAVPLLFHTATVMIATLAFPEDSFNAQFNELGGPGAVFAK